MEQIILYYKFTPIEQPELMKLWLKTLCEKLNLTGRILVSPHGVNGTLGGDIENLKTYIKETKQYPGLKDTVYKWSDGGASDFPRLSVKVKPEIVAFGNPGELKVDHTGVVGGGTHLKPEQVHELVATYGEDVVFFDGRNSYEAAIGKFKNAIIPDVTTTRDFITELESGKYDWMKNKHVITYCTGGVRCEMLSPFMRNRGFKHVYQIDGGIVKYGEKYGDDGLWEGSLYVFDKRMSVQFSDHTQIISTCSCCNQPTTNIENVLKDDMSGREDLILVCETCVQNNAIPGLRGQHNLNNKLVSEKN